MDNSQEIFVGLSIKPFSRSKLCLSYLNAKHGNEYQYTFEDLVRIDEHPVLENITWENKSISLNLEYEFLHNCHLSLKIIKSDIKGFDVDNLDAGYYLDLYTPSFLHGSNMTIVSGLNFGF